MSKNKLSAAVGIFEDTVPTAKIAAASANLIAIAFAWDFSNIPIEDERIRNKVTGTLSCISLKLLKEVCKIQVNCVPFFRVLIATLTLCMRLAL